MISLRRGVLLCLLLAGTAGCDRVTKHLAVTALAGEAHQSFLADTVRLQYHENPGAFLAFGSTWSPAARTAVFQFGNALIPRRGRFSGCPLPLVARGTMRISAVSGGRLVQPDRSHRNRERHRLQRRHWPVRTGIFNVADVAIMAGMAVEVAWGSSSEFLHLNHVNYS